MKSKRKIEAMARDMGVDPEVVQELLDKGFLVEFHSKRGSGIGIPQHVIDTLADYNEACDQARRSGDALPAAPVFVKKG